MDNSSSNSTCSTVECLPIAIYQILSIAVLYTSLNTALSPKIATDSSDPKAGSSSTQTQHLLHQSVDKKHCSFHVQHEV
jgi:hypothetical protein